MSTIRRIVFREGSLVDLVLLTEEDAPTMAHGMNNPSVTQFLMLRTPMPLATEIEWIRDSEKKNTDYVFGIWLREQEKLIGVIGLHGIHYVHRTATTGTVIYFEDFRGMGYGTEAKMLLLDFAFNSLDLYGILSRVFAHNGRSLRYAEKSGYHEVGRIPEWVRGIDGKRHDEVILAVTQDEWRPLWEAYLHTREAHAEKKDQKD